MKKSFLLLPITALVLTACTSSTPAPVESVDGSLSPGMMQPVDNGSGAGTWQPEIQQSTMPDSMNMPTGSYPSSTKQTTVTAADSMATTMATTTTTTLPQNMPAQTKTVCKPVQVTKSTTNSSSQSVNIPRNAETNAPDYSKIDKGFYKGTSYTVRKGDTMFLIAYISGMDVKELASLNNMTEPYRLAVGQVLKIANNSKTETVTEQRCEEVTVTPAVTYTPAANGTQYGSDGTVTGPVRAGVGSAAPQSTASTNAVTAGVGTVPTTTTTATTGVVATAGTSVNTSSSTVSQVAPRSNIAWQWPTSGKVIQGFSNADGGNKGIDISGSKGQAVNAAAAGRVVYAGNALRGYGNLIIIKHNDDFLSAYAHNDSISVSDQQEVKAGQQIAKLGSSGTTSNKLHFEIRYKGKSVDPTGYLPKR